MAVQIDVVRHLPKDAVGFWRAKEKWREISMSCIVSPPFLPMFAFKEWTLICEALGSGAQSIIIRKGGIAEGRDGFRFKHPDFLLFPTLFHEQVAKLKLPPATALPESREDGQHAVSYAAHVDWTHNVTDWDKVKALAPFHLWTEAEIEKRYRQDDEPGVSLAFVRISRLSQPLVFPDSPKYGGCRSWIELPDLPDATRFAPVLDEATHLQRSQQLLAMQPAHVLIFGTAKAGTPLMVASPLLALEGCGP